MLLEVIAISLFAGWIFGGKISHLVDVKLVGAEFIIAAFVAQMLVPRMAAIDQSLGYLFHVGSYLMLLIAFSRNEPTPAVGLMAMGVFLNFVVISLNGGMPVRTAIPIVFTDSIHLKLAGTTWLPWLGDVIPWPLPAGLGGLVSVGDILLSAGVATMIVRGMRYSGKRRKIENGNRCRTG
ncbi:MAG: DUF5317 family protein [Actinomycetota bacterium]|nr:DUF5317 family protein [Actinomycetota bacterium]